MREPLLGFGSRDARCQSDRHRERHRPTRHRRPRPQRAIVSEDGRGREFVERPVCGTDEGERSELQLRLHPYHLQRRRKFSGPQFTKIGDHRQFRLARWRPTARSTSPVAGGYPAWVTKFASAASERSGEVRLLSSMIGDFGDPAFVRRTLRSAASLHPGRGSSAASHCSPATQHAIDTPSVRPTAQRVPTSWWWVG